MALTKLTRAKGAVLPSPYKADSVSDMLELKAKGSVLNNTLKIGDVWSSGATNWQVISIAEPVTIQNFKPLGSVYSIDFGTKSTNSESDNKTIIEDLINSCIGTLYMANLVVTDEYGYDFTDSSTYLTKTDVDAACTVVDFSSGSVTNSGGLKSWGGQSRTWMFAEGEVEQNGAGTGIGNTAGNSTVIHGLWNPGLVMQVNGINIDNRRVKCFFGALGTNYWSYGMGNQTIPYDPLSPSEQNGSNEKRRRHWNVAGKTNDATGYQNKWVIRQDNGHQGWNVAEPSYTYHFVSNPNTVGTLTFMLENLEDETVQIVLKSASEQVNIIQDNSAGGRLLFKNTAGDTLLQLGADGEIFALKGVNHSRYTTAERLALTGLSYGTTVVDSDLRQVLLWESPGAWFDANGNSVP